MPQPVFLTVQSCPVCNQFVRVLQEETNLPVEITEADGRKYITGKLHRVKGFAVHLVATTIMNCPQSGRIIEAVRIDP